VLGGPRGTFFVVFPTYPCTDREASLSPPLRTLFRAQLYYVLHHAHLSSTISLLLPIVLQARTPPRPSVKHTSHCRCCSSFFRQTSFDPESQPQPSPLYAQSNSHKKDSTTLCFAQKIASTTIHRAHSRSCLKQQALRAGPLVARLDFPPLLGLLAHNLSQPQLQELRLLLAAVEAPWLKSRRDNLRPMAPAAALAKPKS